VSTDRRKRGLIAGVANSHAPVSNWRLLGVDRIPALQWGRAEMPPGRRAGGAPGRPWRLSAYVRSLRDLQGRLFRSCANL